MEIHLTEAERAQLIGMSVASARLAIRAKIVLACAVPEASNAQVARDLGIAVGTVRKWRAAFARGGLDALADEVRTGRPKAELAITDDERAVLQRWARRANSSKAWLARHPRFHMHFTPTGSSWINQVERWFGYLTDQLIRRGVHKSVQSLEQEIRDWLDQWNDDPKPFVWTKTADEILESLARYCRRISDAGH